MDKNQIIATMKLLKEFRNEKLNGKSGNVLDVQYIGNINKDEEKKQKLAVYLVIEQYKKDNQIFEIERYYSQDLQSGDIKFLAGNNINDGIDTIYLSQNYTKDEKTKEFLHKEINSIPKEAKISLLNQEKLEKMAKELGISVEEIESMVQLDLDKEVDKDKNQEGQNEERENSKENVKKDKQLNKKQTKELTESSGKQELNIDTQFDGKNTLKNELGLTDEYKSVMVVYSEKLKDIGGKYTNSPLAFVAIDKKRKGENNRFT